MLTAEQVADYFLRLVDEDSGDGISNLKLQKLVYYAQAWHLAVTGEPLFLDDLEAWKHGPVVRSLYIKYKHFGWEPIRIPSLTPVVLNAKPWEFMVIPRPRTPVPDIDAGTRSILNEVWQTYGQFSAKRLEELTHTENPWIDARRGCGPGDASRSIISIDVMRNYYSQMGTVSLALQEAHVFDALADDAIEEYRAGNTISLRALALK